MPELPEVETTRRGIAPWIVGREISRVIVMRRDLRQPIPASIETIQGTLCTRLERRAKYLQFFFSDQSEVLCHLGMSGSLRLCEEKSPWKKHDHLAWEFSRDGQIWQLRYHDPRRFGLMLHSAAASFSEHSLLKSLGPEPLSEGFSAKFLLLALATKNLPIKQAIMDGKIVVGVGNIYAAEALFLAKISPLRPAKSLSLAECKRVVNAIQNVLRAAIEQGGTTLRDFVNPEGAPGYFAQKLLVYQKKAQPCPRCQTPIEQLILAQRSTFWCPRCQG